MKIYLGVMYDAFEGATSIAKTYAYNVVSIEVVNDSTQENPQEIILDVGYTLVRIKQGEKFNEVIIPTKTFSIQATGPYRCLVRGAG